MPPAPRPTPVEPSAYRAELLKLVQRTATHEEAYEHLVAHGLLVGEIKALCDYEGIVFPCN